MLLRDSEILRLRQPLPVDLFLSKVHLPEFSEKALEREVKKFLDKEVSFIFSMYRKAEIATVYYLL